MNEGCAGRVNLLIFCRIHKGRIYEMLTHGSKHLATKPVAQKSFWSTAVIKYFGISLYEWLKKHLPCLCFNMTFPESAVRWSQRMLLHPHFFHPLPGGRNRSSHRWPQDLGCISLCMAHCCTALATQVGSARQISLNPRNYNNFPCS